MGHGRGEAQRLPCLQELLSVRVCHIRTTRDGSEAGRDRVSSNRRGRVHGRHNLRGEGTHTQVQLAEQGRS